MCCLFGLYDYKNVFTAKRKARIIRTLSIEAEERGTDATGIAYTENGIMTHRIKQNKAQIPMGYFLFLQLDIIILTYLGYS